MNENQNTTTTIDEGNGYELAPGEVDTATVTFIATKDDERGSLSITGDGLVGAHIPNLLTVVGSQLVDAGDFGEDKLTALAEEYFNKDWSLVVTRTPDVEDENGEVTDSWSIARGDNPEGPILGPILAVLLAFLEQPGIAQSVVEAAQAATEGTPEA